MAYYQPESRKITINHRTQKNGKIHKIKSNQTIHYTIRRLKNNKYIIVGYHHTWEKSHALHCSYPRPKSKGKMFEGFGQAFEYAKKYLKNGIPKPSLPKPLAVSDYYHDKIHDNEESICLS